MKRSIQAAIMLAITGLFIAFQNTTPSEIAATEARKFKIIWHIGTNVEPLADSQENDSRIELIKSKVDGYYFLVLTGGLLSYWPERPLQCRLDFKHLELANEKYGGDHRIWLSGVSYGAADEAACVEVKNAWLTTEARKAGYTGEITKSYLNGFAGDLHEAALKRVITKLNIAEEQKVNKKLVMSEMHIVGTEEYGSGNGSFFYNENTDRILINKFNGVLNPPKSYSFLLENGITLNRGMTYQEHHWQSQNGNLLRVPLEPGGSREYKQGCEICLPNNIRMLGMLNEAFVRAELPPPKMSVNIRIWSRKDENNFQLLRDKTTSPFSAGINVEGSLKKDPERIDSTIQGVSYILKETDFPVTLLIPGSLDSEKVQTNSEANRDELLIQNLISYVDLFNQKLSAALSKPAGVHAICNPRLSIVVGSYGDPVHMETLPLVRRDKDGNRIRRAGTVGSQIIALNNFRERLCAN